MPLCSNRYSISGSPSTCTLDTLIVPAPSFGLLAVLASLSLGFINVRNGKDSANGQQSLRYPIAIHLIYLLLVLTTTIITLFEVIRLAAEGLGVGLLPANSIGLLVVLFILWREGRGRSLQTIKILVCYWFSLIAVIAVKMARLHTLEQETPNVVHDTKYHSSDQLLDNVNMAMLYSLFFINEVVTYLCFSVVR
ncbi:hypothetical protein PM082_008854 [Marasmius tenuissimus]|nr:hypothetical protein PM082_008854 [Marasmius tenuissimus]